jgi:hypothetical protein
MFAVAVEPKKRATAFAAFHTSFDRCRSDAYSGVLLEALGSAGMKAFFFTGVIMLVSSLGAHIPQGGCPVEEAHR